jgi:phosphoserine phosphatase
VPRLDAVVFDLDGTLVRYHGIEFESSWGAIAAAAGVSDRSLALLREYLPRKDAYPEWVARDAELLSDLPASVVVDAVLPAPYAAGVRSAIDALRGRYRLGILSSGIDLVADWVRQDLGLDFALANHLETEDGRFTGRCETRVDLWRKDEAMRRIAEEQGFPVSRVCFVGDHLNDVPVMRIVGLAIAANPKDERVRDAAHYAIEDFSELPALIDRFATDAAV